MQENTKSFCFLYYFWKSQNLKTRTCWDVRAVLPFGTQTREEWPQQNAKSWRTITGAMFDIFVYHFWAVFVENLFKK